MKHRDMMPKSSRGRAYVQSSLRRTAYETGCPGGDFQDGKIPSSTPDAVQSPSRVLARQTNVPTWRQHLHGVRGWLRSEMDETHQRLSRRAACRLTACLDERSPFSRTAEPSASRMASQPTRSDVRTGKSDPAKVKETRSSREETGKPARELERCSIGTTI